MKLLEISYLAGIADCEIFAHREHIEKTLTQSSGGSTKTPLARAVQAAMRQFFPKG